MRVHVNNQDYILQFQHSQFAKEEWKRLGSRGVTVCSLMTGEENPAIIAQGVAECGKQDQFCRAEGRQIALQRALMEAGVPHDERKLFWNEYGKRVRPYRKGRKFA